MNQPHLTSRVAAWTWVALAALELAGRQVARRSIVHAVTHQTPSIALVVVATIFVVAAAIAADRRRSPVGVVFGALLVIGLALQLTLGARLQSDGFYYFAYLRSIAFDRDVDFTNDYRMLGLGDKTNLFVPTRTGHAQSAWTIGPAVVWSPFFAAGHLVATALHRDHPEIAADGTSFPYRQAVCVASLCYGLLGCWFTFRFVRRLFPAAMAAAAVTLATAGSFLLWYLVKEPSMTHAASMASVAAVVWYWAATRDRRTAAGWMLLGVLVGFSALIRWQNVLFALLPGIDAAMVLWQATRAGDAPALRRTLGGSALFLGAMILAFSPQMMAWQAIYGSWIARSPVGPQVRWFDPHLVDILWSARNGLFTTTPLLYLGAIGLVILAFVRPAIALPALAAIAVMTYFNACIQDWWGSAGFGARRFDGTIPLFALGLAAFVDAAAAALKRYPRTLAVAALSLLALWNLAAVDAANAGAIRIGETLAFDRAWAAQAAVIHRWFGNPFTYPASLVFAARNRLSPGDYDLLSTNRFLADPLQPYGRIDVGTAASDEWLIEDGWYAAETEGAITYRWAASPAGVRIPLDHAATLAVQIRLHAFAWPGSPPQHVTIAAGGRSCGPQNVPPAWTTVECTLARSAWRAGVNRVQLSFDYQRRPMDIGAGGDPRQLAAAVDWIRIVARPDVAATSEYRER